MTSRRTRSTLSTLITTLGCVLWDEAHDVPNDESGLAMNLTMESTPTYR
jgi:hypothetical protein